MARPHFKLGINDLERLFAESLHSREILVRLDEELAKEIEKDLPENIPHIFISSATNKNIAELKDLLWKTLNEQTNQTTL